MVEESRCMDNIPTQIMIHHDKLFSVILPDAVNSFELSKISSFIYSCSETNIMFLFEHVDKKMKIKENNIRWWDKQCI